LGLSNGLFTQGFQMHAVPPHPSSFNHKLCITHAGVAVALYNTLFGR